MVEDLTSSLLKEAKTLRLPIADLRQFEFEPSALSLIKPQIARDRMVIPLGVVREQVLLATTSENVTATGEYFSRLLGRKVQPVLVEPEILGEAIRKLYPETSVELTERATASLTRLRQTVASPNRNDSPIAKLVNHILGEALHRRASDVHFEAAREGHRVRFRIDGCLVTYESIPEDLFEAVVSRLKILCELDIAEHRRPQDGRSSLTIAGRKLDIRVSVIPGLDGECLVARFLGSQNVATDLSELGFPGDLETRWRRLSRSPHGILLVTGPTGAGKTSTLYSTLSSINTEESKLVTLEQPVEARLPGVTQIPINENLGVTFASALRSALRHDPDVMLVGEIRDKESAEIAVAASLTGHLLFATLHTNSAIESIVRLRDIGLKDYQVMSSLKGVLAQRLMRRLCLDCKELQDPRSVPAELLVENQPIYQAKGCEKCSGTGYHGRLPVFELLEVTPEMSILRGDNLNGRAIHELALAQGFQTLAESARERLLGGQTSLSEYYKLTGKVMS